MPRNPMKDTMPFLEHLGELRTRILWSVVAIAVGLGIALNFTDRLMKFVRRPFDIAACRKAFPDFKYTPFAKGLELSR